MTLSTYVQGMVKKICKGIFRHSATCTCPAKTRNELFPVKLSIPTRITEPAKKKKLTLQETLRRRMI